MSLAAMQRKEPASAGDSSMPMNGVDTEWLNAVRH
jgi:hypothetical protein